jgi:hypothetical protein
MINIGEVGANLPPVHSRGRSGVFEYIDADQGIELPSIGPIVYASVDSGLTVVHDASTIQSELGGRTWLTAIPEREVYESEAPPLKIMRAPDDLAVAIPIGAPMTESSAPAVERIEPIERLTFAQVSALMRHRVEGRDGAPLGGGGSSGRARTKPPKRQPIREIVDDETGKPAVPRYKVLGLTRGERDAYDRRDGFALQVLRDLVGAIIRDEITEPPQIYGQRLTYCFSIYETEDPKLGLLNAERRILARYPRSARRALIQAAHMVDGPRVRAIDGTTEAARAETKNAFGTLLTG